MHAIVYGGAGALGDTVVKAFKEAGWATTSVDTRSSSQATNNVNVNLASPFLEQANGVIDGVASAVGTGGKVDAVICVAGGWAGGNAAHEDFLKNSELMWAQSGRSSLVAAHIAARFLKEGGLLTLTGASAALKGATPGMIGYGMVKAAVHHMVSSLSMKCAGLPSGAKVNAILPITLDTPMNRKAMPGADTTTWTPMDVVAGKLLDWAKDPASVKAGALVEVVTKEGKTEFVGC